jgi:hypothetical protein
VTTAILAVAGRSFALKRRRHPYALKPYATAKRRPAVATRVGFPCARGQPESISERPATARIAVVTIARANATANLPRCERLRTTSADHTLARLMVACRITESRSRENARMRLRLDPLPLPEAIVRGERRSLR